jgi:glucose dehydrogenase
LVLPLALLSLGACAPKGSRSIAEWPAYGGHNSGDRYSALTQITPSNDGRQFVAIATNNARNLKAQQGGAYVAFALPQP